MTTALRRRRVIVTDTDRTASRRLGRGTKPSGQQRLGARNNVRSRAQQQHADGAIPGVTLSWFDEFLRRTVASIKSTSQRTRSALKST